MDIPACHVKQYPLDMRKYPPDIQTLKGSRMKHVFIVDGHDMQQRYDSFKDARKAALRAPWSNGMVYKHPAGPAPMKADQGKLVFTAPGAPYPR